MSNHDGSYMLNEVLSLLQDEYAFFDNIEAKTREEFIIKILKLGGGHDCNNGEILSNLGKKLEFCYYCKSSTKDFDADSDICNKCRVE